MLVVPPLSLCHSLRSSFDGKGHSRAHTHSVCVRVSAHEGHHFARTRDLCHRRTSEESGRERGAVRRQKKYHRGRGAVVRHARETPPTSRRRGKKFLLFPLTPSLSRVSLLFRDSIADPRNYFCRLSSFDRKARRHRRSRLSTGDDN